jgi:SIR2-like domain
VIMAFDPNAIPPALIKSYLEGKCGFFIGAGVSRGAGLPDWRGLLLQMVDRAVSTHLVDKTKATECRKLADDPNKYLMLAEEMKEVLGGVEFKTVIEEVFIHHRHRPTTVHELLVRLKHKKLILTTNYDMLIENAFVNDRIRPLVYKYYEAHAIQRSLFKREFFVLKAHGDAETAPEQIILTERDYRRILYREPGYQSALQSIFTMYSIILIGSALVDPELRLLLNYINAAFPEGGVPHYALMSDKNISQTESGRLLKDYNMRIIPISPKNNYRDIETFLQVLVDKERRSGKARAR